GPAALGQPVSRGWDLAKPQSASGLSGRLGVDGSGRCRPNARPLGACAPPGRRFVLLPALPGIRPCAYTPPLPAPGRGVAAGGSAEVSHPTAALVAAQAATRPCP